MKALIFAIAFSIRQAYEDGIENVKAEKQSSRGGARKGAGRKPKQGWKRRPLSLRDSTWTKLKRFAAHRKKRGEKNASMTESADALIAGELVYYDLEAEKLERLEALAAKRGCSLDELVREAIAKVYEGELCAAAPKSENDQRRKSEHKLRTFSVTEI
jgi:hypothetical protein